MSVREQNIDHVIELAKEFSAGSVCQFHGFFNNWGHFDVNPNDFPTGVKGLEKVAKRLDAAGIDNTTYTLTTFLKPHPGIEPYIAPVPDDRLAYLTLDSDFSVAEKIDAKANTMKIKLSNGLTENVKEALRDYTKVLRIDNELIEFKEWKDLGNGVIECSGLTRGGWLTTAASHNRGEKAKYMLVRGYHNLYPGTFDMSTEVAENIANVSLKAKVGRIVLDGYESIVNTGYCSYGRNHFIKKLYDMTKKREMLFTGSNLGNYSWHIMSFMSWGEYNWINGFRGTMLEFRLNAQRVLDGDLLPKKLGQYYPRKDTSVEDIEWLCNQISGWDSGVDLSIDYNDFKKNKDYKKITSIFRLWEEARKKNVFTELQKINLRQTTSVYRLIKKGGKYKLQFVRHWIDGRAKELPSSAIKVKPLNKEATVSKCSIDWKWTHNPAIYSRIALSDDLICSTGDTEAKWEVITPKPEDSRGGDNITFRCVIRLPKGATAGVKDITIIANNMRVDLEGTEIHPGEYLAIPHNNRFGYIYDSATNKAKRVVNIYQNNRYWALPSVKKGKPLTLRVKAKSTKPNVKSGLILNMQYYDKYYE
jgi:hypothetical protein